MVSLDWISNHLVKDMKPFSTDRRQTLLLFAALSFVCLALFPSNGMAENTIDFSKSHNLKAIYDAGLRPWRVRANETRSLKITNEQVRIIGPGTNPFSVDVEIGDFRVLAGNDLGSADFISPPMSVQNASAKTREIAQALSIQMTGLAEKVSQLTTLGRQTPAPQYWNGRGEANDVRFEVTLNPLFGWEETRAKVSVSFTFYKPGGVTESLTEPIKPPPGYEHMSMVPPETHPEKPFPDPAYSRENMRKKIEDAKASGTPASVKSSTPAPSPTKPSVAESPAPAIERKSPVWPWLVGMLVLVVIVAVALKRRT